MTATRAVAFSYEVHVPMHSSHSAYSASPRHSNYLPDYTMQSTSASRNSSVFRASSEVAVIGGASGHFSTYVPGVGEDITSSSTGGHLGHLRRVGEGDHEGDPGWGSDVNGSLGDLPIASMAVMLLLYGGYIARREKRKRSLSTTQTEDNDSSRR